MWPVLRFTWASQVKTPFLFILPCYKKKNHRFSFFNFPSCSHNQSQPGWKTNQLTNQSAATVLLVVLSVFDDGDFHCRGFWFNKSLLLLLLWLTVWSQKNQSIYQFEIVCLFRLTQTQTQNKRLIFLSGIFNLQSFTLNNRFGLKFVSDRQEGLKVSGWKFTNSKNEQFWKCFRRLWYLTKLKWNLSLEEVKTWSEHQHTHTPPPPGVSIVSSCLSVCGRSVVGLWFISPQSHVLHWSSVRNCGWAPSLVDTEAFN